MPKDEYVKGRINGYHDTKNYESKSELEKWSSDVRNVIFGFDSSKKSDSYKSGYRDGKNDYYKKMDNLLHTNRQPSWPVSFFI
jgi:hypothetical protein